MPVCIYCKSDSNQFTKAEHVLSKGFGKFKHNLTLLRVVCDPCNEYFGKELELYLGRDTPDGLNRVAFGAIKAEDYKSLGARSSMKATVAGGPFAGAAIGFEVVDGELLGMVKENVGFRRRDSGEPFRWYLLAELPAPEALKVVLGGAGEVEVQINALDNQAVAAELAALGYRLGPVQETRPAGWRGDGEISITGQLGQQFGRCVGKICFNYLAKVYGAETALLPEFDPARRFVRYGGAHPDVRWAPFPRSFIDDGSSLKGHAVAISWHQSGGALARLSFAPQDRNYAIWLSKGPSAIAPPPENKGHFFNLATKSVEPMEAGKRTVMVVVPAGVARAGAFQRSKPGSR